MKRQLTIDGRTFDFEVSTEGDVCRFRADGGVENEASVIEVEPGIYSVLWNGRSYEVKIASNGDPMIVDVHGARIPVEVVDPRTRRGAAAVRGGEERQAIMAPMPGKVVRVLVSVGDEVQAGQGAIVVEAMKMQNEMKSPRAGVVISINVKPGDTVNAGDVLAVVE